MMMLLQGSLPKAITACYDETGDYGGSGADAGTDAASGSGAASGSASSENDDDYDGRHRPWLRITWGRQRRSSIF